MTLTDVFGSLLFILLFLARVDQGLHGSPLAWFLALQSSMVAFRIVFHRTSKKDSTVWVQWLAWLSALAPLATLTPNSSTLALGASAREVVGVFPTILPLPGLALSVWSLFALGDSFSIAPSDRGLVLRGPYRFIRHPMYAGEVLALIGTCVSNSILWNWSVLFVFILTVYIRIIEEESVLQGYRNYTRLVSWRLVPYVW